MSIYIDGMKGEPVSEADKSEPIVLVRQILNHYNSQIADIMRQYAISEPRIRPGRVKDFDAAVTHQMDIEQESLLRIIQQQCNQAEIRGQLTGIFLSDKIDVLNPDNPEKRRKDRQHRIAELQAQAKETEGEPIDANKSS